MENSVEGAKLVEDTNSCQLSDLEVAYKGIQDIYTVTEDGSCGDLKETYGDESEFAYYYCNGCQTDWSETMVQSQAQAWKLAKEHLGE